MEEAYSDERRAPGSSKVVRLRGVKYICIYMYIVFKSVLYLYTKKKQNYLYIRRLFGTTKSIFRILFKTVRMCGVVFFNKNLTRLPSKEHLRWQ